jgi:hypothetical protein
MAQEPDKNDDKDSGADPLKDAEKRARDAEKRAKDLEAAAKKREADENAAKEAAKIKDLDDAKAKIEALQKREAEALKKAEELEARARQRVEKMAEGLPEDAQARVAKFKDKLSLADWSEMVEDEVARGGGSSIGADDTGDDFPQPANPGGRRNPKDMNQLHPKTEEILDNLGQDLRVARELVTKVRDPGDKWKARHVYPVKGLVNTLKERVMQPTRMNEENLKAVIARGKLFRS